MMLSSALRRQLGAEVKALRHADATILGTLLIVGDGAFMMVIVLAVLLPIIQLNTFCSAASVPHGTGSGRISPAWRVILR